MLNRIRAFRRWRKKMREPMTIKSFDYKQDTWRGRPVEQIISADPEWIDRWTRRMIVASWVLGALTGAAIAWVGGCLG